MALIIWRIPALQVHPMKIIFWIMILDSITIWEEASYNEVCKKKAYELFALTVFYSTNTRSYARALTILVNSKFGLSAALYNGSVILNICLCWDLIAMINEPLSSKESRTNKYLLIAIFFVVITFILRITNDGLARP